MVRYEPAEASRLSQGCQPATRALQSAIGEVFPELESGTAVYGCWNRRHISGSPSWSLHAEGRAIDTGVPPGEKDLGWALACTLVGQRIALGTMRVIWDGHIWSTERPDAWNRVLPSTDPHLSHVHSEQFWRDAVRPYLESRRQYVRTLRAGRAALTQTT